MCALRGCRCYPRRPSLQVAWIIAFVAQIAVTRIVGHSAVGVMWFAVFLQLFVVVGVAANWDVPAFRPQACAFSTMAAVFAVIGVDMSIFAGQPARNAMAAGWVILAVVDILWVLYFSTEPGTPLARLFDAMVSVGSPRPRARANDPERQMAGARPGEAGEANFSDAEVKSEDETKVGHDRGGDANGYSPEVSRDWTGMGRQRIVETMQDHAAGLQEDEERNTRPAAQNHSFPPSASQHRRAVYVQEPHHLSTIYDQAEGTSENGESQQRDYPFRVRARSNWIPRSPSEISFKKGDILHSAEKEGKKWWKVRKADGTVGSAPSNYFKVLNS
ncbi:hypothetical protein C8R47DRAFT_517495 [Mycena vitilis]|nr:hypothetical protein C8R47DRAFT_517495 [Mycena vitilis]